MKKNLPNVFANPLNKTINNVQEFYYGDKKSVSSERSFDANSILRKINQIFNSPHHVYKSKVRITTNEGVFEKEIVGKSNGNLLTLNNESIKIIDILDIERI